MEDLERMSIRVRGEADRDRNTPCAPYPIGSATVVTAIVSGDAERVKGGARSEASSD